MGSELHTFTPIDEVVIPMSVIRGAFFAFCIGYPAAGKNNRFQLWNLVDSRLVDDAA